MEATATLPAWTTRCPSCGRPMRLVKTIALAGSYAEQCIYECKTCGVTYTEAGETGAKAKSS